MPSTNCKYKRLPLIQQRLIGSHVKVPTGTHAFPWAQNFVISIGLRRILQTWNVSTHVTDTYGGPNSDASLAASVSAELRGQGMHWTHIKKKSPFENAYFRPALGRLSSNTGIYWILMSVLFFFYQQNWTKSLRSQSLYALPQNTAVLQQSWLRWPCGEADFEKPAATVQ